MSDSYLDNLPSQERQKIRRRMRSAEAYEKLREKVKGPEDLEREMEKNDVVAELHFSLESNRELQEKARASVERDIHEKGIESVLEKVPDHQRKVIESGKFRIGVASNPSTHHDQLVVIPEGTVQEKIPIKPSMSDRYMGTLFSSDQK
jgi:DNA-directed RNA polymerase sigma subunit (sigma70/sigma32)